MKQISPALGWCGTCNNYDETELKTFLHNAKSVKNVRYVIGQEVAGSTGTPHLQMYFWCPKRWRAPSAICKDSVKSVGGTLRPGRVLKNIVHWERAKGSLEQNVAYCTKDGNYVTNIEIVDKPRYIHVRDLRDYFLEALSMHQLAGKYDPRLLTVLELMRECYQGPGNVLFPGYDLRDLDNVDFDTLQALRVSCVNNTNDWWNVPKRLYEMLVELGLHPDESERKFVVHL